MEEACDRIVTIYYQYAARSKDPNGDTLDGAEFKKLVDEQFYHLVKVSVWWVAKASSSCQSSSGFWQT